MKLTAPLLLLGATLIASAATAPAPIKIAVFDFELEDASAAGAFSLSDPAHDRARMQAVTEAARKFLAQTGRYTLVDTQAAHDEAVEAHTLRQCDGCDAGIARKLGAEQSMIGVVTRAAKTEYYASVQITDARTGKVIDKQSAFFTGADDAWPSGVRMLLKHQVLAEPN